MKIRIPMLMLLMTLTFGAAAPALSAQDHSTEGEPAAADEAESKEAEDKQDQAGKQAEEKEEAAEEDDAEDGELARMKRYLKGIEKVIGTVKVAEADILSHLKHKEAFNEEMSKDEKYLELMQKSAQEAFDHALKSDTYKAWAEKNGLNAEDWLRKFMRTEVLHLNVNSRKGFEDGLEGIANARKLIEEMKGQLSEDDYKSAMKGYDTAEKALKDSLALLDGLPAPADDEKQLIEKHAEALGA